MSTQTATQTDTSAVVKGLEILIADSYALMAQTHLAHWNVEGSDFYPLHLLFQTQYEELFTGVDTIAEHLRTLEVYAPGGLDMMSGLSSVGAMRRQETAKDFIAGLVVAHEGLVENAKGTRDAAADCEDKETEDLCIERIRVHEKAIWMLKSSLK